MPTIKFRLAIAAAIALVVGLGVPLDGQQGLVPRALLGFCVGGLSFAVPLLIFVLSHDGEATEARLSGRDGNRALSDVVVIAVGLASLLGVGFMLVSTRDPGARGGAAAIGLITVAVGWLCVHTVYLLRYARIYYASDLPPIDFNTEAKPSFSDFAYFSFNLGMTYQVSDTSVRTSQLRRVILFHTLLSYVYGTIVIAAAINLVVGLSS